MKYLYLPLILILTSCSLDKNSAYWNEDRIKKTTEDKKLTKVDKKFKNYQTMTFDEFNLSIKEYGNKADYPDINN